MMAMKWSPGLARIAGAGLALTLMAFSPARADVTVRVVDTALSFEDDTTVAVDVAVESAAGVAGLEFVLEYSVDRLAGEGGASSHVDGNFDFDLVVVNHEFAYEASTRTRQLKWAGASAAGATAAEGIVTTLSFPVTCAGYAQAFPQGRLVTLRVVSASAYDELAQPLAVQTVDGTLDLNCTSVSTAEGASFGTVKAMFGLDAGGR